MVSIYRIMTNNAEIILHWDFLGRVTDYGNKYLILLFPVISLVLYFVIDYYLKNPKKVHLKGIAASLKTKFVVRYFSKVRVVCMLLLLYLQLCASGYIPFYALVAILGLALIFCIYLYVKATVASK